MPQVGPYDFLFWVLGCCALCAVLAVFVHSLLVHLDLLDYRASGGKAGWWRFRQERERCKKTYRRQRSLHSQGIAAAPQAPSLGAYVRYLELDRTSEKQ